MLRLEDVTLTVGTRELFTGATVHVHPGDRIGLFGVNGAGKTSLLRMVVGELEPEAGRVVRRAGSAFGYLPQKAVAGSKRAVWDEVQSGMDRLQELAAARRKAEEELAAGVDGAISRLDDLNEQWRLHGGWSIDERVGEVLHGLGFRPSDWQRPCDEFSGGWQMRIALARILLTDPDVLLLDEPTNHLDIGARTWLGRFLAGLPRTIILVSHDRWLLDQVCTRIAEIRRNGIETWKGNLSAWLAARELADQQQAETASRNQEEIDRLQGFVDRFKAKASKASQAKSREKMLQRIERVEAPVAVQKPRLRLPEPPGCSQEVLELRGASIGWTPETPLLRDVDLLLLRGERVAVLGPNGSGKSTLLAALAGTLPLISGRRRVGKDVRIGMYQQDLAQTLPGDRTAVEHVVATSLALPEKARAALGALGLRGDQALRPISLLSGGEKARVVLASFALQPANVLLLDEPTNHLDAITVDTLVGALEAWDGTLVVVTHDRYVVEKLANIVLRVEGDRVVRYDRLLPELLEPPPRVVAPSGSVDSGAGTDHEDRKRRQRERTRLQRQYDAMFEEAGRVEAAMKALDARMAEVAGDWSATGPLVREHAALERKLEELFDALAAVEGQIAG